MSWKLALITSWLLKGNYNRIKDDIGIKSQLKFPLQVTGTISLVHTVKRWKKTNWHRGI